MFLQCPLGMDKGSRGKVKWVKKQALFRFKSWTQTCVSERLVPLDQRVSRHQGTSVVVQWLRLCSPSVGGSGLIPGQGTRSHMPQLKIPHATAKAWYSQINKYFLRKKEKRSRRKNT